MKKDNIDMLFDAMKTDFDIEIPNSNHEQRFLEKLNAQNNSQHTVEVVSSNQNFWRPFIGIAASIALLVSLFIGFQKETTESDLASISPEMAQTESFFRSTIALELSKIEKETSPETQKLIKDALLQIKTLESEYNSLREDLSISGNDKRVIYAMISNFQNRIEVLQNVLEQIEQVKQLKNYTNENSITL